MQAHRHFYAQNLFLRETFAQNNFAQKTFDTEKFVHTDCAQIFLQTDFSARRKFTQSNFCTAEPFSQKHLRTKKITHCSFYMQTVFTWNAPPARIPGSATKLPLSFGYWQEHEHDLLPCMPTRQRSLDLCTVGLPFFPMQPTMPLRPACSQTTSQPPPGGRRPPSATSSPTSQLPPHPPGWHSPHLLGFGFMPAHRFAHLEAGQYKNSPRQTSCKKNMLKASKMKGSPMNNWKLYWALI